ncbi:MAG: CHAT domain-containing protein [Thermoanaerobaculia bacterium]|nr:CHAT domain-containing protein [Thermoanaerobaculia bacterium]
MERESFVVRITSLGEAGYEVHASSPAGEATETCDLSDVSWLLMRAGEAIPADPDDWRATGFDKLINEVDSERSMGAGWDAVTIGTALHKALFSGSIQRLFDESRGLAAAQDNILPIEFRFEPSSPHQARLASLPWELLYDPDTATFIGQREATPITRYLAFKGRVRRLRAPAVWRILIVASSPSDLVSLEWSDEIEVLSDWPQANILVEYLFQPTRETLRAELRKGYHALHFLGHGEYDSELGEGSIALVDPTGSSDWLSGRELAEWTANNDSLRLVVLNSCSTAEDTGPQPFAGVATALVRRGVAAALAMRRAISGEHALAFARVLYGRLSAGRPLDAALSSARSELAILEPGTDHWATPLLFTHTNDVFHIPKHTRETLTRMFSWLGVTTAVIAFNAWSGSQGGPQIPGINFYEVHQDSISVFGVLAVVPLLIPLLLVALRYQQIVPDRGLLHRVPSPFDVPASTDRRLATFYKAVILFVFIGFPAMSQFHFQNKILHAEIRKHDDQSVHVKTPSEHFFTPPPPLTETFDHDYYIGPQKPSKDEVSQKCIDRSKSICEVTFFPFWQPWLFLLLDIWAWVLTIAVLWGVWAKEPLFRVLGRSFR